MSLIMLSGPAMEFIAKLSNTNRQRCMTTSIGIAKLIADKLNVPSGLVNDDDRYFETMHLITVKNALSSINESLLIDVDMVTNLVRGFYKARYTLVNPMEVVFCLNPETAVVDFFGISRYVDSATLAEITAKPAEVMEIYNGFREVMKCLPNIGNDAAVPDQG